MPNELSVKLVQKDWEYVLTVLGKQPFEAVAKLIQIMVQQIDKEAQALAQPK